MSTADSTSDATPVEDARDELQESVPEAARTLRDLTEEGVVEYRAGNRDYRGGGGDADA